jgi:hypothetical protein
MLVREYRSSVPAGFSDSCDKPELGTRMPERRLAEDDACRQEGRSAAEKPPLLKSALVFRQSFDYDELSWR